MVVAMLRRPLVGGWLQDWLINGCWDRCKVIVEKIIRLAGLCELIGVRMNYGYCLLYPRVSKEINQALKPVLFTSAAVFVPARDSFAHRDDCIFTY